MTKSEMTLTSLVFFFLTFFPSGYAQEGKVQLATKGSWAFVSNQGISDKDLEGLKTLIFNYQNPPSIKRYSYDNLNLLAYLSLQSIKTNNPFRWLVDKDLMEGSKLKWSHPNWSKILIERIIPYIIHLGFNGLLFTPIEKDENLAAFLNIIHLIRINYPRLTLAFIDNRWNTKYAQVFKEMDLLIVDNRFKPKLRRIMK